MTQRSDSPRVRVAGACFDESRRLLVIGHEKNGKLYWLLPGGGVDFGESLEAALIREFREELNVDIRVGDCFSIVDSIDPAGSRHVINIHFFCRITGGDLKVAREERLHSCRYIGEEEIDALVFSPPIDDDIRSLIRNEQIPVYRGVKWQAL